MLPHQTGVLSPRGRAHSWQMWMSRPCGYLPITSSFVAAVRQHEAVRAVSVTVAPLAPTQASAGLLLVSFAPESEPRATAHAVSPASDREETESAASQSALEEELKSTRAELQSTIEQMESANEELKAGHAILDYREEGLHCELIFPWDDPSLPGGSEA
jgi:hypothetical protein